MKSSRPSALIKTRTLKIIVGTILVVLIGFSLVLFLHKPTNSQFTITASENKFHASFQLSKYEQGLAQSFLQQANIQQNLLNGFDFALDGTSSARLAYVSPIKTDLDFAKNKLSFKGETEVSIISSTQKPDLNINYPETTTVALFGQNLVPFIEKGTTHQDLKKWMGDNLKNSSGQYLIVYRDNPDFALVYKKDSPPDFEKIKSLKVIYKEETQNDITFHLVDNFVIFELGDLVFVTPSLDSAKDIASGQKDASKNQNIFGQSDPINFAIVVHNSPDHQAVSALKFLIGDEQKLTNYIEKIKSASFFLKDNTFHGEVELSPN